MDRMPFEQLANGGTFNLQLRREDRCDDAVLVVLNAAEISSLQEEAAGYLGASEQAYLQRDLAPVRRQSFLLGRIAGHRAIRSLQPQDSQKVSIDFGVFGQPIVAGRGHTAVSISHAGDRAAALAFPGTHPLALDLENCDKDQLSALRSVLTQTEVTLVQGLEKNAQIDDGLPYFILWSAREALSKVLGCGFMCSAHVLAVEHLEPDGNGAWSGTFAHFGQWAFVATFLNGQVLVLVHPKRTRLEWISSMNDSKRFENDA